MPVDTVGVQLLASTNKNSLALGYEHVNSMVLHT